MKLTEFLQDVGRPVAYFPKLKRLTGSTTATILLCQFIYWVGKGVDKDGWLYKTSEEIEEETGLSYNEQKTARKILVDAGLLEEHYARLDHQLRFRLDLNKINEKWGTEEPKNGECDDSTFGNDVSPHSLNSINEITTERVPLTIENAIFANQPITEEMVKAENLRDIAPKMFERALGFSKPLPWWSNKDWTAFAEWVCERYAESKTAFGEYNIWRNTPYTKGGMSNNRIRGFVNEFYDSWDMFKMEKKTDDARPQYKSRRLETLER